MVTAWVVSNMGWGTISSPGKGLCTSSSVAPHRIPWRRRRARPSSPSIVPRRACHSLFASLQFFEGTCSPLPYPRSLLALVRTIPRVAAANQATDVIRACAHCLGIPEKTTMSRSSGAGR
jgi:hypothetical protein